MAAQVSTVEELKELEGLKHLATGKVRELFEVDEDTVLFVASDRISAFDVVMKNGIPGKGKVLTQLSAFWFNTLFADVEKFGPNHLITTDFDKMPASVQKHRAVLEGRTMLVRKLEPVMIEAIVRGYITGSGWKEYQREGSVCKIKLPEGLQNCEKLAEPLFTPSTKAGPGEHDENISEERAGEIIGKELCAKIKERALHFYKTARDYAAEKGIIIADTKFEFGTDKDGNVYLIDEVLTPDSSRFWSKADYKVGQGQKSFDKQDLRDFLAKDKSWDKSTPVTLPDEVLATTSKQYLEISKILAGKEIEL